MLKINITPELQFEDLNRRIHSSTEKHVKLLGVVGQRYIGAGLAGRKIEITGTPGNALGAYLNGSAIIVNGNVQDATGDTMNGGSIVVHGNAGDATGYAMRGGEIYICGNTGYRAGIHMKAYENHQPAVVVGGKAGSFLGEYQAGGKIIILNLNPDADSRPITGEFLGTGMHGGAMYLRMETAPDVPKQISVFLARGTELPEIKPYIGAFCEHFKNFDKEAILNSTFAVLKPNSANPYHQLYTAN